MALATTAMISKASTTESRSKNLPPTPNPTCVDQWLDLMHTCEVLLLAGMRRRIGPEGDLAAEYRRWYREQMREHDELLGAACERLVEASVQRHEAT